MNNPLKSLPAPDRMLVVQSKHFKGDIERHMHAYQQLLLLGMDMASALSCHRQHHDMVEQWAVLVRELI